MGEAKRRKEAALREPKTAEPSTGAKRLSDYKQIPPRFKLLHRIAGILSKPGRRK